MELWLLERFGNELQRVKEMDDATGILLDEVRGLGQVVCCQGPWNVDLQIPPGQECSNGSLLCIRRGHPGI